MILMRKSTGKIAHWLPDGFRRFALCGERPKRGTWCRLYAESSLNMCPTCAKIKAAREKVAELGLQEIKG